MSSYEPSLNGSVAESTAGSELDFGGENEAQYTLPSLTTLVRKSSTPKEPSLPAHRGAPTEAPTAGVQRPAAAYSHGSGVMWPFY